jgi:hypothetical protein
VHSEEWEAEVRARPHVWCELNRSNAGEKLRVVDLSTGPCLGCRSGAHAGGWGAKSRSVGGAVQGPCEEYEGKAARSREKKCR